MNAAYTKPLASSEVVIACFAYPENTIIKITKRLFFHICTQAAQDKSWNGSTFADLMHDINRHEDTVFEHPIKTNYAAPFFALLAYIPWNGKTDEECGVVWHETMMNDTFVNLGFSTNKIQKAKIDVPTRVYIFAQNEDDFDSEMDHRQKIENEFKALLIQSKKT